MAAQRPVHGPEYAHDGTTFRLIPRYGNVSFDVIWIDYLPFDQFAQSSEWWDNNAQEFWAILDDTVSCQTSLQTQFLDYLSGTSGPNQAIPDDDTAFLLWDWCTRRDGVSRDAVAAARKAFVQSLSDRGVRGGSSLMFPFLGTRNGPGEFAQMFVSPDWATIASYHEYVGNGGWRNRAAYNENIAQCLGQNVYDLTLLNRARTP